MASKGGLKPGGATAKLAKRLKLSSSQWKAIGTSMATIVEARVFPGDGAGRDRHNKPFSAYSTKPTHISKKSPPRPADMPAPKGGVKPPTKKSAKAAKTMFFPGGYSQYRAGIGRSSGAAKNLRLTSQTARAFNVLRVTQHGVVIGFRTRKQRARQLDGQYDFMALTLSEKLRFRKLVLAVVKRNVFGT